MMRYLVVGALNIDRLYAVDHIVQAGETISASRVSSSAGGKALNQAVALARAGASTAIAGQVGPDGGILLDVLDQAGVDTSKVRQVSTPSGQAVIQLDPQGGNCIILSGGANREHDPDWASAVIGAFAPGDLLVLQNEVNGVDHLVREGHRHGLLVALNASPVDAGLSGIDLDLVDYLFVNEIEGCALSGVSQPDQILAQLRSRHPQLRVVLTLGSAGARYSGPDGDFAQPAPAVRPVDTTAAGDTFTGYFLANAADPAQALQVASIAAGIAITRPGASASIPDAAEVQAQLSA